MRKTRMLLLLERSAMQAICCREGADHCYDKEETMTYTTRRMSLLVAGFGLMVTVVPSRAGPPNNDVSDLLRNTAGGSGALQNNTTGFDNTAFGFLALTSNKAGDSNTAFGKSALRFNTTGTQNTAVGLCSAWPQYRQRQHSRWLFRALEQLNRKQQYRSWKCGVRT